MTLAGVIAAKPVTDTVPPRLLAFADRRATLKNGDVVDGYDKIFVLGSSTFVVSGCARHAVDALRLLSDARTEHDGLWNTTNAVALQMLVQAGSARRVATTTVTGVGFLAHGWPAVSHIVFEPDATSARLLVPMPGETIARMAGHPSAQGIASEAMRWSIAEGRTASAMDVLLDLCSQPIFRSIGGGLNVRIWDHQQSSYRTADVRQAQVREHRTGRTTKVTVRLHQRSTELIQHVRKQSKLFHGDMPALSWFQSPTLCIGTPATFVGPCPPVQNIISGEAPLAIWIASASTSDSGVLMLARRPPIITGLHGFDEVSISEHAVGRPPPQLPSPSATQRPMSHDETGLNIDLTHAFKVRDFPRPNSWPRVSIRNGYLRP